MNANAGWPDAILWDMDGTLIDTEPYWIAAEVELCDAHGASWTHADGLTLVGNPLVTSAEVLRDRGVDLPIPAIIDALLAEVIALVNGYVPWQEDARRLLHREREGRGEFRARSSRCRTRASPTPSSRRRVAFDAVVTGRHGRPGQARIPSRTSPRRRELGVPIERCLAIEDSPVGDPLGSRLGGAHRRGPAPDVRSTRFRACRACAASTP